MLPPILIERSAELAQRTGEHIVLTGIAIFLAVLAGLPLGIACARNRWMRSGALWLVGVLQTIPSLAMLAILLALTGLIGTIPAVTALTLYALLPIVRNTVTGLDGVDAATVEAARGVGMTGFQRLWMVELPLALPVIVAGVRTAAVIGVGIATLAAFIGAGGLGEFIFRGLGMMSMPLMLLGAIPAAILALVVDFLIWTMEWAVRPGPARKGGAAVRWLRRLALVSPLILLGVGYVASKTTPDDFAASRQTNTLAATTGTVVVGSKDFTEQRLLGEMLAQLIEHHTRLDVQRRFGLSTTIAHNALTTGQIDLYAEYTGTAYINVLKREEIIGPFSTYAAVDRYYRQQLDCDWLEPLGFNNTYAITVRREQAEKHGWQTISDLEPMADELSGGFPSEFMERPDGYRGLCRAYGFSLGQTRDLSSDLMVEALARGQVDVISAFATDGRISEYDLKVLDDDRHYFPPYQAAPVVRQATLNAHPRLKGVLNLLAGRINDATMQRLNFQVQGEQRSVKDVAGEFLRSEGLLPGEDS